MHPEGADGMANSVDPDQRSSLRSVYNVWQDLSLYDHPKTYFSNIQPVEGMYFKLDLQLTEAKTVSAFPLLNQMLWTISWKKYKQHDEKWYLWNPP